MTQEYKKIFWKVGLEITPETFMQADHYICTRQNLIRKIINRQYYGLLPADDGGTPSLTVDAALRGSEIHIEQLTCYGVTREGYMVDFETGQLAGAQKSALSFAGVPAPSCYVVLRVNPFEHTLAEPVEIPETPFALPVYELDIKELTQIEGNELPVLKIGNIRGNPQIDRNYVPPCMALRSCRRLVEYYRDLTRIATEIVSIIHAKKAQYQPAAYPVTSLLFDLEQFSLNTPPYDFIQLLKKTVMTIGFFIRHSQWNHAEIIKMPYNHNDVAAVLQLLTDCFREIQLFIGQADVVEEEDFTPQI